jgi:hypothetical protein
MIKYKAEWGYFPRLSVCEVEKETDKCVWVNGYRNAKESQGVKFYDTFEEAQQRLIRECETDVRQAKSQLDKAEGYLQKMKDLQPPQGKGE